MSRQSGGGILVIAVVSLSVATLLAIGAAASMRTSFRRVRSLDDRGRSIRLALECIESFAREALLCDSNGYDFAGERWSQPFPEKGSARPARSLPFPATIEPEFDAGSASCCIDEESRLPVNHCPATPLAALIASTAAVPPARAKMVADEIIALRPYARREFILRAPSLDRQTFLKIAPYITAAPVRAVNINTASPEVLEALFTVADIYGGLAARSLAGKISDFRKRQGVFTSIDESAIAEAIGGLNLAEAEALSSMRRFFSIESRYFSGAARCGSSRVLFTIDRDTARIVRLAVK